jgi:CheY-like chemotaxis protein
MKIVLLIDNDRDEHLFFKEALEAYDKTLVCLMAFSCMEGINIVKETPPDVIFLDIMMPSVSGLECLKILKETPLFKDIPVYIYSSSVVTEGERSKALELGAVNWFSKPYEAEGYNKIFREVFGKEVS